MDSNVLRFRSEVFFDENIRENVSLLIKTAYKVDPNDIDAKLHPYINENLARRVAFNMIKYANIHFNQRKYSFIQETCVIRY